MNDSEIKKAENVSDIPPQEQTDPTFFAEIVKSHLPEETIKEKIGSLKEAKGQRVEPVKTATDQEKIDAYDNLKVQDLPDDWKKQLVRLKYLEGQLANYIQVKDNLTSWTNIFGEKKPGEVQEEINQLEEKKNQTETELNSWKQTFKDQTPSEVEEKQTQLLKKQEELKKEITELTNDLNKWTQTWEGQELTAVKEKWDLLNKRPDISSVTEKEFWDDYACRPTLDKYAEQNQQLAEAQSKITECQKEIEDLCRTIDQYLENERTKRYVLVEPVVNFEQAQTRIAKLLEETGQKWRDYLNNKGDLTFQDSRLIFSLKSEEKKNRAYQILLWMDEAKQTKNYQQLFEKWCDGKEYNKEYDFDGSLYLLKKLLEVKNEQLANTSSS